MTALREVYVKGPRYSTLVLPFLHPPFLVAATSSKELPAPPGEVQVGRYCVVYPLFWTGRARSPAGRPRGLVGVQGRMSTMLVHA